MWGIQSQRHTTIEINLLLGARWLGNRATTEWGTDMVAQLQVRSCRIPY